MNAVKALARVVFISLVIILCFAIRPHICRNERVLRENRRVVKERVTPPVMREIGCCPSVTLQQRTGNSSSILGSRAMQVINTDYKEIHYEIICVGQVHCLQSGR